MRTVYATQFLVLPEEDTAESLASLQEAVGDWVIDSLTGRWSKAGGEVEDIEVPMNGRIEPADRVQVQTEFTGDPGGTALWRLQYAHPDDRREDVRWRAVVQLASYAGGIEFNLKLQAGYPSFRVSSFRMKPGRPRLIRDIIEQFTCSLGGRELRTQAEDLTAGEVSDFITETLLAERRPSVVVVAPDSHSGEFLLDADRLADRVAGLSEVYRLADVETSYALSDELPPKLSVYHGAVRVYWDGFDYDDSPYWHSLFTGDKVRRWNENGVDPIKKVSQHVISASAGLRPEGDLLRQARKTLLEQHKQEVIENAKKAKTVGELKGQVSGLLEAIEQKEAYISTLEDENEELRNNFRDYARSLAEQTEVGESDIEAGPPEPDSVADAVQAARDHLSEDLWVWDSAIESAETSSSKHADRVYETLEILADVGRAYLDAKAQGEGIGKPLREVFSERNAPKYSPHESETTKGKYAEQRAFVQDGRQIEFERHFTLGIGSRENCVQIYFAFDEETDRTIVGYCGPHLEHARQNT